MSYFQSIELENYRNFKNFKIDFSSVCNVLIGKNGSGKTNVLEAISLFERGRGLRKDSIKDLVNYEDNKKHFNVFSWNSLTTSPSWYNAYIHFNANLRELITLSCCSCVIE